MGDIDECLLGACGSAICVNANGNYSCTCDAGFTFNSSSLACDDVNECDVSNAGCSDMCENTLGSHQCQCPVGYQLDDTMKTCEDVDECSASLCQQSCNNLPGSYECSCIEGFTLTNETQCVANRTCTDVQEAACVNSACHRDAITADPICECNNGYQPLNATYCGDINECDGVNACHQNATCTNKIGGYSCECDSTFITLTSPPGTVCLELTPPVVTIPEVVVNTAALRWGNVGFALNFTTWLQLAGSDDRLFEETTASSFTTRVFSGLNYNSSYTFYIASKYGNVTSRTAQQSFTTLTAPLQVPNVTEITATSSSINVQWIPIAAPVSSLENFITSIYVQGSSAVFVTLESNLNTTGVTVTGLQPSTQYRIEVATKLGSDLSEPLVFTQYTAPSSVTNLQVVYDVVSYGSAQVSWNAPAAGEVASYELEFTPSGPTYVIIDALSTPVVANVSSLEPGTEYSISVYSVFQALRSVESSKIALVAVTTPVPDPTTSGPDPTTSGPDPTTSGPDPTTSVPDPTTSEPDPTTSGPDPTTSVTDSTGIDTTTSVIVDTTSTVIVDTTSAVPTTEPTTTTSGSTEPTEPECDGFLEASVEGVCVETLRYHLSVTFNSTFDSTLNSDPESSVAQTWSNNYRRIVGDMVSASNLTVLSYSGVSFRSGSIIAESTLTIVDAPTATTLDGIFQEIFTTDAAVTSTATTLRAIAVNSGVYDECASTVAGVRDNCDVDTANCISTDVYPGFTCECKVRFRDNNSTNPGTICENQCQLDGDDYCQNGATCSRTDGDNPSCLCSQWYQGERCETLNPLLIGLIAGITIAAVVILLLCVIVCAKRSPRRGNSYWNPGRNHHHRHHRRRRSISSGESDRFYRLPA